MNKRIFVVVPVLNEEDHIECLLKWLVETLPIGAKAYIVDGGSTDKTVSIIKKWQEKYPDKIELLQNPNKYVPFAINMVIRRVNPQDEDIIIRLDAHTHYANDYFEKILLAFEESGSDIVGGPQRKKGLTPWQKAIAKATQSPFGIGDSAIHFNYEGPTDTVYLGAWKGKVFRAIGLFDESLPCNEDEEFHYRAKNAGLKIYQTPEIKAFYLPRKNLPTLFKQYFRYGYYKPEVIFCKTKRGHARHLVPALFVAYLVALPVLVLWHWGFALPLLVYLLLDVAFAFKYADSIKEALRIMAVYPVLHIAYGSGFWLGLWRLVRCWLKIN
ncbi:MAG: glycosyltransferase family 2 protein [Chlorobi bacterium]|nr:glycosyltransferase family 2 protein [Chlorobiota bacterium]